MKETKKKYPNFYK